MMVMSFWWIGTLVLRFFNSNMNLFVSVDRFASIKVMNREENKGNAFETLAQFVLEF